jgi:hypothetical protein
VRHITECLLPARWRSHVMTLTLTEPLKSLRKAFDGELLTSEEQVTYDAVRALWNTAIDRRPAVIARCVNRMDVGDHEIP